MYKGIRLMWNRKKGAGEWCPENDGAYRAEMAAIHGDSALADVAASITVTPNLRGQANE
jgi:hypothetical protein